jgi:hypothetical protein
MYPAAIARLAGPLDPDKLAVPRFLTRWTAWEALRFRTLVFVAHARGWSVKDAHLVLDRASISSMPVFRKALRILLGGVEAPLVPAAWQALSSIAQIRHKLVHGVRDFAPEALDALSAYLEEVLSSPAAWLAPHSVDGPGGPVDLRDPRQRLRAHSPRGGPTSPAADLEALLVAGGLGLSPAGEDTATTTRALKHVARAREAARRLRR